MIISSNYLIGLQQKNTKHIHKKITLSPTLKSAKNVPETGNLT